jgi:hypothetical protein
MKLTGGVARLNFYVTYLQSFRFFPIVNLALFDAVMYVVQYRLLNYAYFKNLIIYLGISLVMIGNYNGYAYYQSLASFEIYLRALNQTEISSSMERSLTWASNANCNFD